MERIFESARSILGEAEVITAFVELAHLFAEGNPVRLFADSHGRGSPHADGEVAMFPAVAPGCRILFAVEFHPSVFGRQQLAGLFNLVEVRCSRAALVVDELQRVLEEGLGAFFVEPDGVNGAAPKNADGVLVESAAFKVGVVAQAFRADPAAFRSHPVGNHAHAVSGALGNNLVALVYSLRPAGSVVLVELLENLAAQWHCPLLRWQRAVLPQNLLA